MSIQYVERDLLTEEYEKFFLDGCIAVDTETTGLNFREDSLCIIQLYSVNYNCIIRYSKEIEYTNLKKILEDKQIKKIFHNAVFDVSFLMKNLYLKEVNNIACTRISSKLVNGLGHNNSLKPLLKEYLNVDISKEYQVSDWNVKNLSQGQLNYAINDVRYLDGLWKVLEQELENRELKDMAEKIFEFIPTYVLLQMKDIDNIFVY